MGKINLIDLNNDSIAGDSDDECNIRPVITMREANKKAPRPKIKRPRKPRKVSSPKKTARRKNTPNYNLIPEEPDGSTDIRGKIYACYNKIPNPYKPFLQFQYDETVMNNPYLIQDKLRAAKRQALYEEREKENLRKNALKPTVKATTIAPVGNSWYPVFSKPSELQPTLSVKTKPIPLNHISKRKRIIKRFF